MNQQLTSSGAPYSAVRYKQIVQECFIISKNIHTSYNEVLNISPLERSYLLEFLVNDAKKKKAEVERIKAEREANRKNKRN